MNDHTRIRWVRSGTIAVCTACIVGVTALGAATASAEPGVPEPVVPPTVAAAPAALPGMPASTATAPLAAATPALVPATSGTIREFFDERGVTLERQVPQGFTALNIVLPMPTGWAQVPDPNVPDAFVVLADKRGGDLYTANAQLVVYKLIGDFDSNEAITHGFIDSQTQTAWQATDASLSPFGGFPSSRIDGTYRSNDLPLNASRRHVIAQSGEDRYLLTLTVTTTVGQSVAASPATDAVINGFKVTDPAAPTAPAAVTPAVPADTVATTPVLGAPTVPGMPTT